MIKIIVTGGCGFIGYHLVKKLIEDKSNVVLNIDNLSYGSDRSSHSEFNKCTNYEFKKLDIRDFEEVDKIINEFKPLKIFHLAAESHVDRSISDPRSFIGTNINGTYNLLEASRKLFSNLDDASQKLFKFVHVSTDEVFGDLEFSDDPFVEESRYRPSSPYAASKAASDHLVKAWERTYKLPCVITNCSNNYGPNQNREKLIPKLITNALNGRPLPIYGSGLQIRDWLFVEDHVSALIKVSESGSIGHSYLIGGKNELTNIEVAEHICKILDQKIKDKPNNIHSFGDLIEFVNDRPGHDIRYAIDPRKIMSQLHWRPQIEFVVGLGATVDWYVQASYETR